MISVIIPHRVDDFLNQTIEDLLKKAEGEIEVIVACDGVWPAKIVEDPRVRYIHQGTVHNNRGMRAMINAGVAIARGTHLLKADEHTMWDQGFDLKLKADCEDNWLVVPRRYRLDADNWTIIEDGRPPVDYMYIEYPFLKPYDPTQGLHGAKWDAKGEERKDVLIDDLMTMQGSAWFMPKKLWDEVIVEMDEENYGPFTMEAQELSNKVWLSGGRVIVNKKTWYAHLHKGKKGKGYGFSNKQYENFMAMKEKGRQYAIDYWLDTKDFKYDFAWLVEKFSPLPGWPDNWQEKVKEDSLKDFRYSPDFTTWKAK